MICRLLFFSFLRFRLAIVFSVRRFAPFITPYVSLSFSFNNTVLPVICDGCHFIHTWKALHRLIISLKGEVRDGIYSIVFGYIFFIDVKWLEHWTISTDNIWKVFRLELKDILIQQQFVFIGKDWTISISDDSRVNNYTNCEANGAGSTDLFRIFEFTTLFMGCLFLHHQFSVHLRKTI